MIVPNPPRVRRALLALAGVLAALWVLSGAASATASEYGELGSVSETGKVDAQASAPHVFGVDPTDDSFYVGDEVEEGGKVSYRIQKFSASGTLLAKALIKAEIESAALGSNALEGIAVDTTAKRVYLLVNRHRGETEPDSEAFAAAKLYAFSTEVNNSKGELESATGKAEGLLTGLTPLSSKPRVSLLDPHGITIDPSGDVVIVGQEDMAKVEGEESQLHAAVQVVHANGTLGPRYIDVVNCLDAGEPGSEPNLEPACAEGPTGEEAEPFSPIVSPGGKVYVERHGEIWAMPASTTEIENEHERFETHPKRLLPSEAGIEFGPEQTLLEFPRTSEPHAEVTGGTMSFVPEGGAGEGRIYLTAAASTTAGELVFSYAEPHGEAEARELGWTGGQAESAGAKCVLTKFGNEALLIAGGKNGDAFVLDAHEELPGHAAGVEVHEFGPGGTGCPQVGKPSTPSLTVKNGRGEPVEVKPTEVPLGEVVTLSSKVTGGNAKGVKWTFKNLGTGKEEAKDTDEEQEAGSYQFEVTSLKHKFEEAGEYEIIETVATDDLTTPEVAVTEKITVKATPIAVEFSYPETVTAGKAAKLEATVTDPHEAGTPHLKYVWKFGNGEESSGKAESTAFNEEHAYPAAGPETVTLEVTDGHNVSGTATHVISVVEEEHKGGGGGGEEHKPPTEEHKSEPPKEEPHKTESPPEATVAGGSLSVGSGGSVTLQVACPAGDSSCSGSVTLRTLTAVAARTASRHGKKGKHKAILTLATGSFTVAGGQVAPVTLHLSSAGRALLTRLRALRVQATIVARDPAGAASTTQTTVTLRTPSKSKRHRKH